MKLEQSLLKGFLRKFSESDRVKQVIDLTLGVKIFPASHYEFGKMLFFDAYGAYK